MGFAVFVGSDKFGESLVNASGKVYKIIRDKVRTAPSVEKARELIHPVLREIEKSQ